MPYKGYKQTSEHRKKVVKNLTNIFKTGNVPHNKGKSKYGPMVNRNNRKRYFQNHTLLRKYKITLFQYESMIQKQKNRCAICGGYQIGGINLCVDHNHINGKIRGLLCNSCNAGIGYLKENKQILENAIEYLSLY